MNKFVFTFFFAIYLFFSSSNIYASENLTPEGCEVAKDSLSLKGGWDTWKPYQYLETKNMQTKLVGLDIELPNYIMGLVGAQIEYTEISWDEYVKKLKYGEKDIVSGAVYSNERAQFAYFSDAYRFEELSLFIAKSSVSKLSFKSIQELLAQIKATGFKVGVMRGAVFGSDMLNNFIEDPSNKDVVIKNDNDIDNLKAAVNGEIDGFIVDKLVGASMVMDNNMEAKIVQIALPVKAPSYIMFSKKTIPRELVAEVNRKIKEMKNTGKYSEIMSKYLFPVILLQIINSPWFYYITFIGVTAFALSGVNIAFRENMTLFVTFILAVVPSLLVAIVNDIAQNNDNFESSINVFILVLAVVMIGFSALRMLVAFNKESKKDKYLTILLEKVMIITDSLGQSCFIVVGVAFAMLFKFLPVIIWGPIFAFIFANGGTILRDLLSKSKEINAFNGDLNPEISLFWGLVFSLFLDHNSADPSVYSTTISASLVVLGGFLSKIAVFYFNLSNIKFRG